MSESERNHANHRGASRGTAHDHGLDLDRRDETTAIEAVHGTVNETGFVTFPPDSLVNAVPLGDDTCGTLTPVPTTLSFSGNTARFLKAASIDGCGTG